tara:strand:+ start:5007 stop:5405 length:399 start_codon:yes stop_codon:yes gene_type:complete
MARGIGPQTPDLGALNINKKKRKKLKDIEVVGDTSQFKTKILRDSKGRAVGRRKKVGGTDRAPIYKNVKNFDDYTDKEIDAMSDAEFDRMEKSSTIQYKNPDYKGPKKKMVNPTRGFSEGGMIVASQYKGCS